MKIESKEKLAKLLATEDLNVQHQQVKTACFDIKSRTLILPIWKNMSNEIYDLLVGHEVGHALFTPTDSERLKKAYKETSKHCINILEDARIERLVKNRYPGLRKQFFSGYKQLVEKDFFGLSERPISEQNILDKINLYFKIPNIVNITFNETEQSFVDRIETSKSFKDIEVIAKELYAYAKDQKKDDEQVGEEGDEVQPEYSDKQSDGDSQDSNGMEADDNDSGEGEDEKTSVDDNGTAKGEDEELPVDEDQDAMNRYMNNSDDEKNEEEEIPEPEKSDHSQDEVRSTTFEHFQERMKSLVDNETNHYYLTIPDKANLKDAVVDYKVVHKMIDDFYASKDGWSSSYDDDNFSAMQNYIYDNAKKTLAKFKKESVKTVNHIAMEFERKKAADVYKKTSYAKTGILDTNKLFSAKYNDDVFKKNMRIPEGKNHGLVMIVDWSGSMADNIFGCIKQVMELSFFCKKVNIPFEVYSFMEPDETYEDADGVFKKIPNSFDFKNGDLFTDCRVKLRNYLSHRMNAKDYNNGLLNMCILANRYKYRNGRSYERFTNYPCPRDDELRCTPLNGAILLSEHVIRKFRKDNNLQSVHSVLLTDGESSGNVSSYNIVKDSNIDHKYTQRECDVYIKDTKTKKNHLIMKNGFYRRGTSFTPALLDIVRGRLGINIVGFFILNNFSNSNLWRYVPRREHVNYEAGQDFYKKWVKKAKKDGWFVKEQSGYDEYYVIQGDSLKQTYDADLDVKPEMSAHRMTQNFMKKNNSFKTNRVILSRFIDLITENTTV